MLRLENRPYSGGGVTYYYDGTGERVAKKTATNTGKLYWFQDDNSPVAESDAAGETLSFAYGNGVQASFGYNDRLQINSIHYSKSGSDLMNLAYGYSSTQNNGQIQSIADNLDPTRSAIYTYDAWARLATAQAGPNGAESWKYQYSYDRMGNRLGQTVLAGQGLNTSFSVDVNTNRITGTGNTYDAAGNMTGDTMHAYTYDAENRMKTVDSTAATYGYDGDGLRVKKVTGGTTTAYIFSGSKVVAEYNGTSTFTLSKEYVYSGSGLLATLDSSGNPTYAHADHLSTRMESSATGSISRTYGHLPFGDDWYETGTAGKLKFTSYERDNESGLDYAMARLDSSRLGRFMSPDPLAGSINDPQSLNRNAYSRNDPVNLVDPTGMLFTLWCGDSPCLGGSDFGYTTDIGGGPMWAGRDGLWGDDRPRAGENGVRCGINPYCDSRGAAGQFYSQNAYVWKDGGSDHYGSMQAGQLYVWMRGLEASPCPNDACGPGVSFYFKDVSRYVAVSSNSTAGAGNSYDPPVGRDIFHNSPQCPDCGETWKRSGQVATGSFWAEWYAASAVVGGAAYADVIIDAAGPIIVPITTTSTFINYLVRTPRVPGTIGVLKGLLKLFHP